MTMILAVSGWRFWDQGEEVIYHQLDNFMVKYGPSLHVRVGDAEGVDRIVRKRVFAMEEMGLGITYCVYRAEWGRYGHAAGPIRNGKMLNGDVSMDPYRQQLAHRLLAFPQPGIDWRDPGSGTVDCILQAVKLGVTLEVPGFVKQAPAGLWE
jgi:hypothetical protein